MRKWQDPTPNHQVMPEIPRRKQLRIKGHDYSGYGPYFVTICTKEKNCVFGEVDGSEMKLNPMGKMVEKWWNELTNKFPDIELDQFVVMPNHFHGIIAINAHNVGADVGADLCVRPHTNTNMEGARIGAPLPRIIQWFKTMTTNEYLRTAKQPENRKIPGRLWQRNYYEHIIRNDEELLRVQEYILFNPCKWTFDRENPMAEMKAVERPEWEPK